ncbi:unnamed protein product [Schistosoma mattheei]|uniref:Uncharacterized protein n=1 Tax=Schistosoma mattheei TaxID=31246 RepID=A0A183NVY7_9TREM|nr:unnamed protein product [Schistosoma mattheei]
MLLHICNAMKADVGCNKVQLIYRMTLRLPGEFVDPSSSPLNLDPQFYMGVLTNNMHSVKRVSTRPQSTDVPSNSNYD